ncbi:hypothetical protein LLG96_08620 [bacterium]|nr:hypothetical protein [bacterium]
MKTKYIFIVAILIFMAIAFEYYVIVSPLGSDTRIGNAIQSAAVFVALLAATIALSAADPKAQKVKVKIEQNIDPNNIGFYYKSELPNDLQTKYEGFPYPIKSHKVHFKITNTSGFTLKKPTLTFRLPLEKQHPQKVGEKYVLSFNSNLFNSQTELRLLEFADTLLLSNSNLPFWNNDDNITIWIRMLLNDGKFEPFMVDVSVNCENAEGVTKLVRIDPKHFYRLEDRMVDAESITQQPDETTIEHARVGYQVAVSLWTSESEQTWARFNVMIVANSIILAIIGLVVTSEHAMLSISFVMSIVGIIMCIMWLFITKRGFDYQDYYVNSARELEERFLRHVIKTASRGSIFADGQSVTFELDGKTTKFQMSRCSRIARARFISIVVIFLFIIVYVLALLQSIWIYLTVCYK